MLRICRGFVLLLFTLNLNLLFSDLVLAAHLLDIEADSIVYYPNKLELYASGNVNALYQGYRLVSNQFYVNYTDKLIKIPTASEIFSSTNYIKADDLDYDLNSRTGTANGASIHTGRQHIFGDHFRFNNELIDISHGSYTGCIEPNPHYYFKADKIDIYANYGIVILNNTFYYLGGIPVLYVPTYIVGKSKYGILTSQTALPEVGSNEKDGFFIRERFGYFFSQHNSGVLNLGYFAARGPMFGVSHQYLPNDEDNHEFRTNLYTNESYPDNLDASYKYEHRFNFNPARVTDNFFSPGSDADYTASALFSWRDYVNFQYLNFFPRLSLSSRHYDLFDQIQYYWDFQLARLSENNSPMANQIVYTADLYREFLFCHSSLKPSLSYSHAAARGVAWDQLLGALSYSASLAEQLTLDLVYTRRLYTLGRHAFLYESYNIFDVDNLDSQIKFKLNPYELRLRYKYDTEHFRIYDAQQQIGISLDCMSFGLTYGLLNHSFGVYFNLI